VGGYEYTAVGHVTADVFADGSVRPGGSALYSALQAARLGRRALIITQGVEQQIAELLAPYRPELALEVYPAEHTTTLETSGQGAGRRQRLLAWAGPIGHTIAVDTSILHLAPVARETATEWRGRADFIGLTPQGLVRTWARLGAEIGHVELAPGQLPGRCDAIVISRAERESCAWLIEGVERGPRRRGSARAGGAASARGAVVAVTGGADATALHIPGGETLELQVPHIEHFVDDLGAGDVFAAAFFIALQEERPPAEAAAFANAAAAVRIGGAGPGAVGERGAIEARLHALR
jgi:pfkB family carbohydrate kinase